MESSISDFILRIQTPINKLGIKELRAREATWRSLWSWIDDDIKYLVYRIGSTVRILRRDYKGSLGELGAIKFEVAEYEVATYEKRYNETDGKWYYEQKVIKIPQSTVMMLEFISERELAEEAEIAEVMSLEAIGDTVADSEVRVGK